MAAVRRPSGPIDVLVGVVARSRQRWRGSCQRPYEQRTLALKPFAYECNAPSIRRPSRRPEVIEHSLIVARMQRERIHDASRNIVAPQAGAGHPLAIVEGKPLYPRE